jgi:hypothetical protein
MSQVNPTFEPIGLESELEAESLLISEFLKAFDVAASLEADTFKKHPHSVP